ncbi:unnamed protein product, partial [Ascophyllum nodosum]
RRARCSVWEERDPRRGARRGVRQGGVQHEVGLAGRLKSLTLGSSCEVPPRALSSVLFWYNQGLITDVDVR